MRNICLTIYFQIAVDTFFFWGCIYIGKHFELLTNSFDGDKKKFIQRHQSIFSVAEEFRKLIKPILFTQFSISSLKFCLNIFNTLQSDHLLEQFIIIGILLVQLFEYCYGGQLLMDRSMAVGDQFYSSDKDFLIVIARAQKKFAIRAWIYQADLAFVTFVLNSAFSLLAVLRNVFFRINFEK